MTTISASCPRCGRAWGSHALEGLCPRCVLAEALEGLDSEEPPELLPPQGERLPLRFGEYELLRRIASGGMGVVYEARDLRIDRVVALKMIIDGALASEEEVDRFYAEARKAALLAYPHIVPVYEVGECDGRHYFTMRLLEGGSLAEHRDQFKGEPKRAAALVAVIARAIHHGHQRRIIHRDLKPANILLDADGHPHVTDFGVARHIEQEGLTRTGMVVGTPEYMAPEQAAGLVHRLTTAVDVYGLGAILYELLTGQPPFTAKQGTHILQQVQETEPVAPHTLGSRVDPDLETICLKCLEKEPERRYGSAEQLAEELERYLHDEPILARRISQPARVWRWCRRHPLLAGAVATALWLLIIMTVASLFVARAQAQERREEVLRANAHAAEMVAGTVLFQLKEYAEVVGRAAEDPELRGVLQHGDVAPLRRFLQTTFERHDDPRSELRGSGEPPPFENWFIQDTQGVVKARWPHPPGYALGRDYSWRDYFLGAAALGRAGHHTVYISRSGFESEVDGRYRLAISAPLFGEDKQWLGVLVVMMGTGSSLGSLRLDDPDSESCTVIVAPRDRSRQELLDVPPHEYVVLFHEALERGKAATLDDLAASRVREVLLKAPRQGERQLKLLKQWASMAYDNHRDPVMGNAGPWLAGFAPVGSTGLVVIVETRDAATTAPLRTLARRLAVWGGLPFLLGASFISLTLWLAWRRAQATLL
jgi:eukaryotic-like serine/threonine-protein kinase